MFLSTRADPPRIELLGDQALLIILGSAVDPAINLRVCDLARRIDAARPRGVRDVVPSFTAVAVHYQTEAVECRGGETPHAAMCRWLSPVMKAATGDARDELDEVTEIPVCYGGVYGPDLEDAAAQCRLSADELLALHQRAEPLRVYMIGFSPGAPYIGQLDARLSLPRRATPRVTVPAGSVAIANRQSIVYPVAAPGGWSLIGRTPLRLFDPARTPPTLFEPGSLVRFRAIDEDQLLAWQPTDPA